LVELAQAATLGDKDIRDNMAAASSIVRYSSREFGIDSVATKGEQAQ